MSLFQSIGEGIQKIQEKLEEWDEWIHEKTGDKLSLGIVAGGMLLLLFILLAGVFLLQPTGVTFQVLDENGNPIDGAIVRLFDENGNLVATARSINGTVHFDGIPNKKYTFTVSKDGFEAFNGEYDPSNPSSAIVRLKPGPVGGTRTGDLLNPPGTNPPQLPETPILLPGDGGERPGGNVGEPTPPPNTYLADAELTVVVRDKAGGQPILNAIVTLRDAATNSFIVQGPTNAQGTVKAGVRQGSSILVSVYASGFASPLPKTVVIGGPQTSVEMLLSSAASGHAVMSNVTVRYGNGSAVSGARVQIYAQATVADQLTADDGSVSLLLEKDRTYSVRASKSGFQDATASLIAGQSIALVLNVTDASTSLASLLIAVTDADRLPSASAQVGIFKLIGSDWVPFVALTASAQGVVQVEGLQAGWSMRANATSVRGTPSASNDSILIAGNNTLVLRLPEENSRTQVTPTPTPTASPTPTTCPDGTVCAGGQVCVQGAAGTAYTCRPTPTPTSTPIPTPTTCSDGTVCPGGQICVQSGTGGGYTCRPSPSPTPGVTVSPTPTPTPTPGTLTDYQVCRKAADGPTALTLNGFTYSLKDLNGVEQATFDVSKGSDFVCAAYTPRCTYVLGVSSAANDELAAITNVKLTLTSIDPQKSCAQLSASTACTAGACTQVVECPATYDPVCGSNGVTYANSCHAKKAGGAYISGTCGVQCTEQYDPVCASGVEYPNSCIANRNKVQYVAGKCPIPPTGITVDVPAGWSLVAPLSTGPFLATDCTAIYHYVFKGYSPSDATYFNVMPTTGAKASMKYQDGYAVYSDHACKIYWQPGATPAYYHKTLNVGWNLIGAPAESKTFRKILGDCTAVTFYPAWAAKDESNGGVTASGYDEYLHPGKGYWVNYDGRAGTTCTLTDEPRTSNAVLVDSASCASRTALAGTLFACPANQVAIGVSDQVAPAGVFETYTCCNLKSGANAVTTSTCAERPWDSASRTAACLNDEFVTGVRYDSTGRSITAVNCCRLQASGSSVVRQTINGAIPNYAMTFRDGQDVTCPTDKIIIDVGDTVVPDGNADAFNCQGAMTSPTPTPPGGDTVGPTAFVCKRSAVGTCAISGSFGSATCASTCPVGFSASGGSCSGTGDVGGYGISSCSGSVQCQSDESYPALGQCNTGDVQVESAPSDSAYFYTCRRKAVGTCAGSGTVGACGTTCPSGFTSAAGSCTGTGDAGGYGLTSCTGSAECLSDASYTTLSGCRSGDAQVSKIAAASFSICRHKAVGTCGVTSNYQACSNTCPSGFSAAPSSCQSSGADASGYGIITGCSGTADCWSSDYYLASGDCNAGDVKVSAGSGFTTVYAQCKTKVTGYCGGVRSSQYGGCSGGGCPAGYSSTQACVAQRQYGGFNKYGYYCYAEGTNSRTLECLSESTYLKTGGCNAGDVQVGSVTG